LSTLEIVQKLWNLCNVLRDDGITYHQYVTELTYILFLKMLKETNEEEIVPEEYRWDSMTSKDGLELYKHYQTLLRVLGETGSGKIKYIYNKAATNIEEPKNLAKIIREIDKLDWYDVKKESLGNLYEGLLEKNAGEKKSGAGQYFTPRILIDVMVNLTKPQPGEKCNDPAAGTFGFMIAADKYIKELNDGNFALSVKLQKFQAAEAFSGSELVGETHRLALMNSILHGLNGEIYNEDTLSSFGKTLKDYDVVLTNPPFGTKQGGERPTRDDFTYPTSNKQLNFLQHIYRSLKKDGKARAAVVLPDNVLFQEGDGTKIREDLLNKCNLHTVLRLPTGIFYAQGVKTNVLFFTRGKSDENNTKEVCFYDLRTNMPSFGKTTPLKKEHFAEFESSFDASTAEKAKLERWTCFSMQQIKDKNYNLDLGLIRDENMIEHNDLPDPIVSAEEAIAKLEQAADLLQSVVKELHLCGVGK